MIFKRWFKPKWQHQDAAVRLQALESLDPQNTEHKNTLHELAFNDGAEAVRKAALHRLNDFSLWWQASKQDAAERLKLYAEQQLVQQLLTGKVDSALKHKFIEQCQRSSILEQLALQDNDATLRLSLLQRLGRQDLLMQSLLDATFPVACKAQLLSAIQDEKQLEKLSKQLPGELASQAEQQLQKLQQDKQRPVKLRKELTLLLAKLNALREWSQLADIPALQQQLAAEWQQLAADLPVLPDTEAAQYQEKYQQLQQKLDTWLSPKLAALAAEQQRLAAQQQAAAQLKQLTTAIAALQQQISAQLANLADFSAQQQGLLQQAHQELTQEVTSSTLSAEQQSGLQRELTTLAAQLQALPAAADTLQQLTTLLNDFAAQALPATAAECDQAAAQLQQFKQQWRQSVQQLGLPVPADLAAQQQQLQQRWKATLTELQQQQHKQLRQLRSKCAEFKRLHGAGRFKVLFGLYKGLLSDYQQLDSSAQQQAERDFNEITALYQELNDLQQYIATPRKHEMLAQMQQLAAEPVEDAKQRAEQVKLARANWNSLGKADPAADDNLNQAFDEACEAAFAPCRELFAKQDAERAAHLAQRQQILTELALLLHTEMPEKALEQSLRQLTQRWREAGAVKRQDYQALQQQYQQLNQQLRAKLTAAQQAQAAAKQALVAEAQSALSLPDQGQTATVLKELQQRWKQLGFAGKQQDQALWLEFRALCDGFFNQRQAEHQAQQAAQQQAWSTLQQQLRDIAKALADATELSTVQQLQQQLQQLTLPDLAEARAAREQLATELSSKAASLRQQKQKTELNQLFEALAAGQWRPELVPAGYRDALQGTTPPLSRRELTVALELLTGQGTTQVEPGEKQQVQLALLSMKHNGGQQVNAEQLLQHWLAHGPVAANEQPLLQRVAALF